MLPSTWREWLHRALIVAMAMTVLGCPDDGGDVQDTGVEADIGETDGEPTPDEGPTPDMGPDPDVGPVEDMAPPDMDPPECTEDIECAVDSICAEGRCDEGSCVVDPIEGCCTDDTECGDGEVCDLDDNTCVSDPCAGVTCDTPPAAECDENGQLLTYGDEGTCQVVDGAAECAYDGAAVACEDGQICADGACVDDTVVDDCRFVSPAIADELAGTPITLVGQVMEAGLTDLTDGNDLDDGLLAETGWGPTGAEPLDAGWMWVAADADPAWDAAAGDAPGFDQYMTTVDVPDPGEYALAFRFSLDGGDSWLYCDLDGAANGYQADQAGALTAVAGPCDDDPCAELPAPRCDGDVVVTAVGEGSCEAEGREFECIYDEERRDCAAAGGRCDAGDCVDLAPAPTPGQVVVNEILYDAIEPLSDEDAEWIELHNTTETPLFLGGCELFDDGGNADVIGDVLIDAGANVVFAHTDDAEVNGGLNPAGIFTFRLGNDGDVVGLRCGDDEIDMVDYGAPGFEAASGRSIKLDLDDRDAGANDDGANWCPSTQPYFGAETPGAHFGTPGAANPPCPPPTIDYCRLQFPEAVRTESGSEFEVFGIIFDEGRTDASPQVDAIEGLLIEAGVGPDGSEPAGNDAWIWTPAAPNPEWDGDARGEADNDEYISRIVAPQPGEYDFAYRVSLDGETWTFCDLGAGSSDGYQPDQAGQLTAIEPGADLCDGFVCPAPPAAFCDDDGVTVVAPQGPGVCAPVDGQAACTYPEERLGCPIGDRCIEGRCFRPAPAPAPGQVVITEILYDATGDLSDGDAEWIELYNPTDSPLGLDGCTVGDESGNTAELIGLNVEPGQYVVLARSANAGINGGLDVAGTFDFSLGNDGDTITLACGDAEIDAVTYDIDTFPEATAYSISLDSGSLNAGDNDVGANWCRALPVYFEGSPDHHGTPGAPNAPCPTVGICTLVSPDEAAVVVDSDVDMTALLVAAGVTDQTRGVDDDPRVRAEAGYGPADSDPTAGEWQWWPAEGDPENDAANADTYLGTLPGLPAGRFDAAFRFSVDDGRTWVLCDREPGSINGYQSADAAHIVVGDPGDPCEPNPCDTPPAGECVDADNARIYAPIGICSPEGGEPSCEYAEELIECPLGCVDGACVRAEPRAPLPGDLVISELLYDPHNGLEDNTAEWFELYNTTNDPLTLQGCEFADANNQGEAPAVVVEPRAYALFARSDDPALNGGLENVAGTFGFGLNNTDDTLTVSCGGIVIDTTTYNEREGFPAVRGFAIQVRDGQLDLVGNDFAESWCPARTRYSEDPPQWGSPGQPNPPCDAEVDFCRFQAPAELEAEFETVQIVYGRIYEEGITDLSPLNDSGGLVQAQFGFGPDGSLPEDNEDWTWINGFPNDEYDGAGPLGELNNDEYRADIVMPIPGEYDLAVRFSVDGGRTWLHCDGGDPGSSDGYSAEDAGRLVVTPPVAPCEPNPCQQPPRPFCDGNVAVGYPELGVCEVDDIGLAACTYDEVREDCADQVCVGGACGGARAPEPGEVIVSEILYDPHNGLSEDTAEWIELYNTSDQPLALDGCELADSASGTPIVGVEIGARDFALFGRSDDEALNGGLVFDGLFEFALTNGGDTVTISCGGAVIDTVSYDDGPEFPDARAASIGLSRDRMNAQANDAGSNWCLGEDVYLDNPQHLGSPRGENPVCPAGDPCENNPCEPPPPASCDGAVAVSYGPAECIAEDGQAICPPPEEIRVDCGEAGCVDGACDVAGARAPAVGEIIVTEVMANTGGDLEEQFGEWFELYNTTDEALSLDGCEVRDRANGLAADGIVVGPGGYLLFAKSLDPARNGGIVPDGIFNFSLNNGGDIVELRCGVDTIDAIDYGLPDFPERIETFALQLDPDLFDFELNDLGEAWCNAEQQYFDTPPHFGTPGLPNPACQGLGACNPNPCNDAPPAECVDETTLGVFAPEGVCDIVDGAPACDYPLDFVDCAAQGQVCAAGRCIDGDAVALAGDVLITEVMYDPHFALVDDTAEWIELYNNTDRELVLDGCVLEVDGQNNPLEVQLALAPATYAVFARSADPALNGGIEGVAQTFDFPLPNGGARIRFSCGPTTIDEVAYDDGFLFPDARAAAINLDPESFDGAANDQGIAWCLADEAYFADPDGIAEQDSLGTPGLPNRVCPEVDIDVDYCQFQFPVAPVDAGANDTLDVYAIVYEEGITDRTPLGDFDGRLVGEAGYGPRGSDPSGPDWLWQQGGTNPGWNGDDRGQPDNDEYLATIGFFGAPNGDYDLAFRFSLDRGQSHLYCDLDGSDNGFDNAQAVDLTIANDPCANVFCFEPPPSFCQDANTVAFYGGDGQCVVNDQGEGECAYEVSFTDNCAANGQICVEDPAFGAFCDAAP